jgi:hypothetical protein
MALSNQMKEIVLEEALYGNVTFATSPRNYSAKRVALHSIINQHEENFVFGQ